MHDLFNPAGLCMLEERQGAIAYGYVAHRVFYARFVGCLSAELGTSYVERLEGALSQVASAAYFADASALRECDVAARSRFERLIAARRMKFTSIVILTWAGGGSALCPVADAAGEVEWLADPLEFDRALCNVVPAGAADGAGAGRVRQVWQVHAPR
jgi:hypothetical protein